MLISFHTACGGGFKHTNESYKMTDPQITTPLDLRLVAKSALVCGVVGAAGAALWQVPIVRDFASSTGFKKALLDGLNKLFDGTGGSSPIANV